MKLRFTPRAAQDLAAIADYIRARKPAAAQRVRAAILHSLQNLVLRSTTSPSVSKSCADLDFFPSAGRRTSRWLFEEDKNLAREIAAFEEACGDQEPHLYVARACRIAMAHASAKHPSDPDDFHELRRLHVAARVIRALARRFISSELAVSDCFFDGS
jgi:hypothetical protein